MRAATGSGNKAPAPSAGQRLVAAQPGTPTMSCWGAAFSQDFNLKFLILPWKYSQGCGRDGENKTGSPPTPALPATLNEKPADLR